MRPFRHIVVGLGIRRATGALEAGSAAALACAIWLGRGGGVRCTLLHATRSGGRVDPGARGSPAIASAADALREAGIACEIVLRDEGAGLAITRRVLATPADLVLVGKRAEPEEGGPRIGRVAFELLRKCPCAVWAVSPGDPPPSRAVLAACDLTPLGDRVLERASQVAQLARLPLHVVHTLQLDMETQLGAHPERPEQEKQEARERIRASLGRLGHAGPVELHVGPDSPSHAILAGVRRTGADLVVMGTIARGGVAGLLLGNTAERLLERLPVSLLTLKPADFVCPVEPDARD